MAIKAMLFDIGGVLIADIDPPTYDGLAKLFGVSKDDAERAFSKSKLGFQKGTVDEESFWESFSRELGKPVPREAMTFWEGLYNEHAKKDADVFGLADRIRKAGVQTGIVSNIIPPTAQSVREDGLTDGFEPVIFSCEVGYRKPEKGIFQEALDILGLPGRDVAFTDNHESRLSGANELGINTYVFRGISGLEKWLRELGVKI